MIEFLFSFEGRANRLSYFGFYFLWTVLFIALVVIHFFGLPVLSGLTVLIFWLALIISSFALTARRLHDIGLSAWAMVVPMLIGLAYILVGVGIIFGLWIDQEFMVSTFGESGEDLEKILYNSFFYTNIFVNTHNLLLMTWPGDEGVNRFG